MKHNIRIIIEYKGKKYCGWQIQDVKKRGPGRSSKCSVQRKIELSLSKVLKKSVRIVASGRTDSGVHALEQVANFETNSNLSPEKIRLALNGNLPRDIRILEADYVPNKFHSRYAAKFKTYKYIILNQNLSSALFNDYCYKVKFPLNISLMRQAARSLVGKHDFKAFCSTGSGIKSTIRTIRKISIQLPRNIFLNGISKHRFLCIEIQADGFLYNMVRNIVGTLIEIGRGRIAPKDISVVLREKKRNLCGPCVPAKGLYLSNVEY